MKYVKITRGMAASQSKGCLLFIQIGTSALIVKQFCGKRRQQAVVHAEIDTPLERLRIHWRFFGRRCKVQLKPNQKRNNGYRCRWLRKLGYVK